MSWFIATPEPVRPAGIGAAIDNLELPESTVTVEHAHQFAMAKAAAKQIAASGALGTEYPVTVHLSGHANPGHAPRDGWSDSGVHIEIVQHATPGR